MGEGGCEHPLSDSDGRPGTAIAGELLAARSGAQLLCDGTRSCGTGRTNAVSPIGLDGAAGFGEKAHGWQMRAGAAFLAGPGFASGGRALSERVPLLSQ